ncbi:MAG: sulfite exporter TauE/SafE family protein [Betaproteobacteria bacterium]|nr:sulfite exporter TauE/SafE family protein [Betaproteobacteria bacterium]
MLAGLALTAFVAGVAGGPHCVGMCGAALCGGALGCAPAQRGTLVTRLLVGRALGYALAGALVASLAGALQWGSQTSAVFKPVWTMVEVASLVLGVVLLVQARQPVWLEHAAHRLWQRVAPAGGTLRGASWLPAPVRPVAVGMLWAALPCGLLYSALMIAALADGPAGGAVVMLAFAGGTSLSLQIWAWLWQRMTRYPGSPRELQGRWGLRIAGLALIVTAGWALGHGLWMAWQVLCVTP